MGKFNPISAPLPAVHSTWIEMLTGREGCGVRIISLTMIAVNI